MLKPGQTRFILASLVIFYHLSQSLFFGKFAVGCFFILSGYWISLMYEKKYSKKKQALKVFYISRLWRLLPVFYVFSILGLICQLIFKHNFLHNFIELSTFYKWNFIFSNIFILGYCINKFNILVPPWSLDIELQFYILFPLLSYLIKLKKSIIIYLGILFFAIGLSIFIINSMLLSETILYYLYLFFTGVVVYHLKIKSNLKVERYSLILFFLIIFLQYAIPSLAVHYRNTQSQYYSILSFVLTVLATPSLINSIHNKTSERDKFWGEMSFMIYLAHWVWLIPYNVVIIHASKVERIPYVAVFLIITFSSSYLAYKFIDRPSEKLRHMWVNRQV